MSWIEISWFRGKQDLAPVRRRMSWENLCKTLNYSWRVRCTVADCSRSGCPYKELSALSPAVYPPGAPRQKSFVEEVSLLVVDLDHLSDEQLGAALAPLLPYQRILHASHSDRPGDRCVRAIVAISRPVTRDEWPRFWPAAMAYLRQPADPSTCDANRLYYLPSQPKDAESYYFEVHDGTVLDVDAILAFAGPSSVFSLQGASP
jgi:hypothetical protein